MQIRTMTREDLALALDWAAAEGWNPGLADAECFHAADPDGFLVGEVDGVPAGCVSAVRYPGGFGFLGFYIVRPEFRGRGHGLALWRAAMARLQPGVVGLDGVVAQQANYRKSGFTLVHRNVRYGVAAPVAPRVADAPPVVPLAAIPFTTLAAFDRRFFPAPRDSFLRAWIAAPGHVALAATGPAGLQGYAVLRPCRHGSKIGPLFAETPAAARALFAGLLAAAPAGPVFIDLPEPNADAVAMAVAAGMAPAFETARMYVGPAPDLPLAHIYGITSFELG
ncbi:GNAT family N-acetyltransferase [Roseomonas oryzicola]|uniref:GNAT family N-acetyltransferase n=2 Tax=Neoroseomonas oryzicola TaxID=535904 RepID=A0A9X9WP08_9PROT|nr:GNAT family N-acetyltransferase [Neoroseomonas oryzicola]NKE18691.1 GNAT family N-acetyltransferase [Neoroseomonas oryzicola]